MNQFKKLDLLPRVVKQKKKKNKCYKISFSLSSLLKRYL